MYDKLIFRCNDNKVSLSSLSISDLVKEPQNYVYVSGSSSSSKQDVMYHYDVYSGKAWQLSGKYDTYSDAYFFVGDTPLYIQSDGTVISSQLYTWYKGEIVYCEDVPSSVSSGGTGGRSNVYYQGTKSTCCYRITSKDTYFNDINVNSYGSISDVLFERKSYLNKDFANYATLSSGSLDYESAFNKKFVHSDNKNDDSDRYIDNNKSIIRNTTVFYLRNSQTGGIDFKLNYKYDYRQFKNAVQLEWKTEQYGQYWICDVADRYNYRPSAITGTDFSGGGIDVDVKMLNGDKDSGAWVKHNNVVGLKWMYWNENSVEPGN